MNLLTAHATYVHVTSHFGATLAAGGAATSLHHLNTFQADATYPLRGCYTFTPAGSSLAGTADPLLFPAVPVTGSALGVPRSLRYIVRSGSWPRQNTELSVAYKGYPTFNGAGQDYDGFGRHASEQLSLRRLLVEFLVPRARRERRGR